LVRRILRRVSTDIAFEVGIGDAEIVFGRHWGGVPHPGSDDAQRVSSPSASTGTQTTKPHVQLRPRGGVDANFGRSYANAIFIRSAIFWQCDQAAKTTGRSDGGTDRRHATYHHVTHSPRAFVTGDHFTESFPRPG
jgi:hypothetical protein